MRLQDDYYFGGGRSKGFATLRNVSKLLPNVPIASCFGISWSSLIYSYSLLLFWLEISTAKVFYRKQ